MEIEFDVAKDMIFGILTLYLRVRAFAKIQKILENFKEKARVTAKEKTLLKRKVWTAKTNSTSTIGLFEN